MAEDGLLMKTMPHGSGDIHTLLHLSGLTKGWKEQGYTHLYFLQDTNPLILHTAAATIGKLCRVSW